MLRSVHSIGQRGVRCLARSQSWISSDGIIIRWSGSATTITTNTPHTLTTNHLWRSFFYVPGNKSKMIRKIAELPNVLTPEEYGTHIPDLVVLDCEDAVGLDEKDEARKTVCEALQTPNGGQFLQLREKLQRLLIVRINSVDTDLAQADLDAVLDASIGATESNTGYWPGPDLFCLPKVESVDELSWLAGAIDRQLSKSHSLHHRPNVGLVAMIESCNSIIHLPDICQAAKCLPVPLVGVVFGSDDYCVTLGVERSSTNVELSHPRQFVPVVCKAFGLAAIDMVDIEFKDSAKLQINCDLGARLGFNGKQTIHPSQLPIVNQAFSPTQPRVEWATALLEAAKAHHSAGDSVGAHAFTFRGRMIDRPTLRQAEHIVNLSKLKHLKTETRS